MRGQIGSRNGFRQAPGHLHPGPEGRRPVTFPGPTPDDHRARRSGMVTELLGESGLADARLAGDQDQPAASRRRLLEPRPELIELTRAADERTHEEPRSLASQNRLEADL